MADTTTGRGGANYLGGIYIAVRALSQKAAAESMFGWGWLVLSAVAASLAAWLKGTTELEKGLLWGAALTPLIFFVVPVVLLAIWRHRIASRAIVGRLKELYTACEPAIGYAAEFLERDVIDAAVGSDEKRVMAELLRGFILGPYRAQKKTLDAASKRAFFTVSELPAFVAVLSDMLVTRYGVMLSFVLHGGDAVVGRENLISSERYAKLRALHTDFLREIYRVRTRDEIKDLAEAHSRLHGSLPSPPEKA